MEGRAAAGRSRLARRHQGEFGVIRTQAGRGQSAAKARAGLDDLGGKRYEECRQGGSLSPESSSSSSITASGESNVISYVAASTNETRTATSKVLVVATFDKADADTCEARRRACPPPQEPHTLDTLHFHFSLLEGVKGQEEANTRIHTPALPGADAVP
ncbi:hypothetical protein E2C01_049594 [Portunus trituberculatus]|uniref:Uncharacterized protein n=1 Tax=Portunus trituberculatus TaxID=210409 RepID=A0A5B7G6U1_PORTR|nr:hypothetical protein [Portunus trituberculatus]